MFALWLQHESGFNRTASQFCAEYLSQSADLHFCCSSCLSLEFAFPCYFLSVINLASAESWWENYQKKKKMYELLFCHFFFKISFVFCAVSRCAEPPRESEPAQGPATLGEGQWRSRVHPSRAPDPGAVPACDPSGKHCGAEWVWYFFIHRTNSESTLSRVLTRWERRFH